MDSNKFCSCELEIVCFFLSCCTSLNATNEIQAQPAGVASTLREMQTLKVIVGYLLHYDGKKKLLLSELAIWSKIQAVVQIVCRSHVQVT